MPKKDESSKFDWKNMELVGLGPTKFSNPEGADARRPRIANAMYLGQYPKNYEMAIFVDGMTISSTSTTFNSKVRIHKIPINKPEHICLILELDANTIQFTELDDILNSSELKLLSEWINNENVQLLKIANEYE